MSLLLWLLCLIAVTVSYLLVPGTGLLCVLILFIVAPISSWMILTVISKNIKVQILTPGVVEKRKAFLLKMQLHSSSKIPLGRTVIWIHLENTVTGESQKKRIAFRGSGQWILESAYCGCIESQVTGAWCYDLFGVLPVRIPCKAVKRIVVMPDTFPVEIESILSYSNLDECTDYAPDKKGSDRTETLQIRDYVPGDSLQQIHWKLSGKLDKLIVRDPAQPVDRELMVFLDRNYNATDPAYADAMMEAVTSVCQGLTEAGQPFRLAWNEKSISVYEINSKEQLPEGISAMLKSRSVKMEMSGGALYQKTMGDEKVGAVLYFCTRIPKEPFPAAKVQIYLCGEGENVITFTPQNMDDVLRKISWS